MQMPRGVVGFFLEGGVFALTIDPITPRHCVSDNNYSTAALVAGLVSRSAKWPMLRHTAFEI